MNPSAPALSKSRYLAGLQCAKRLWLEVHRPELASEPDLALQARLEMGVEVGRLARALFAGALFEAPFEHAGVRVRVDVLERLGSGRFGLREVKSATRVRIDHLHDAAVQRFVLEGCGVDVRSVEIVHLTRDFVRGEGPLDVQRLFTRADVSVPTQRLLPEVAGRITALRKALAGEVPAVEVGPQCSTPVACPFLEHCSAACAAPEGEPRISTDLARELAVLEPPVGYLDFETLSPALPLHPGTRPYEVLPFQWSLHQRVSPEAPLAHRDFLAACDADPRRAFAEALLEALCGDSSPLLVWSPYEDAILKQLAGVFPDLALGLADVRARLVDLRPIVKRGVRHPGLRGSLALKRVAPVLCPGLGWDDLGAIRDGTSAAAAFACLAAGGAEARQAEAVRAELRAYCARDTEALAALHAALRQLAGL